MKVDELSLHHRIIVKPNKSIQYQVTKRLIDVVFSALGIVLLFPILLIVAIAIIIDSPGNPLFVQDRNGLNGKVFKMFKFRSMCKEAPKMRADMESQNELDGPAFKMSNDPRITRIGKFIRKTSIDELPQLMNIFLGSMSIVGPRPLPVYETEKLTDYQRQRLLVKPGILCYWQIRGRNSIPFDEWMEMDFEYINQANLWTDIKIMIEAIPAVLRKDGAE